MPTYQVEQQMTKEFGKKWRELFRHFEDRPFAAASIGQVWLLISYNWSFKSSGSPGSHTCRRSGGRQSAIPGRCGGNWLGRGQFAGHSECWANFTEGNVPREFCIGLILFINQIVHFSGCASRIESRMRLWTWSEGNVHVSAFARHWSGLLRFLNIILW